MYILGVLIILNESSGNIEVRKVQLTGGSTYTVSLPKRWVDEMSLKPRGGIRIDWRPSGALRLTPIDMANNQEKRVTIDAKSLPNDSLHDHLMGAYLSGADTIGVLYPENSEREYRKQIRRFLKNTRGFETINERQNGLELICLIGASEMPLNASINRMYLQLTSVVRDIISISEGDDIDLLSDVNDRESEVDALLYLVERQVCIALDSHIVAASLKVSRNQAVEHSNLARSLERMMDHAHQMANIITDNSMIKLDAKQVPFLQLSMWKSAIKKLMINLRTRNSHEIEEARLELKQAQNQISVFEEELISEGKLSNSEVIIFRLSESVRRLCAYARDFGEVLLNLKLYDEIIVRKKAD